MRPITVRLSLPGSDSHVELTLPIKVVVHCVGAEPGYARLFIVHQDGILLTDQIPYDQAVALADELDRINEGKS